MKQFLFLLLTLFVLVGFSNELKALNHSEKSKIEKTYFGSHVDVVKTPMQDVYTPKRQVFWFDTHTSKAIIALSGRYFSLYSGKSVPNNCKAGLSRLINSKANE